ncbi:MAG: hypothetical protein EON90_00685 [Brevundimonas sp.]|nr:MAG: hypothetical protein EON90_00685 [Brevundimonas sp.]
MSAPDLDTEEGRAAYRKELRRVGLPIRLAGLALITIGAGLALGSRYGTLGLTNEVLPFAYGALALGWALVLAAIYIRAQHHKRRLREGL